MGIIIENPLQMYLIMGGGDVDMWHNHIMYIVHWLQHSYYFSDIFIIV
jgi:hypothetical protein